jgi:hypothetical protein
MLVLYGVILSFIILHWVRIGPNIIMIEFRTMLLECTYYSNHIHLSMSKWFLHVFACFDKALNP